MKEFTSLADFLFRLEKDKRYKLILIDSHKYRYSAHKNTSVSYEEARKSLEDTIETFRKVGMTCSIIVSYLNISLNKHEYLFSNKLKSATTINTFL